MSNLTITIDKEVLKQARIRAIKQGTSVKAEVRRFLEQYSSLKDTSHQVVKDILDFADKHPCDSGGQQWRRDDLYEERINRQE